MSGVLKEIKAKADYIIDTIQDTNKDVNIIVELYRKNNIEDANRIRSKTNFDDYLFIIKKVLFELENAIKDGNHNTSKTYIKIFSEFFYFSKKFEYDVSRNIYDNFISLCLLYDSEFLNCENKDVLKKWENDVNLYIDKEINFKDLKYFNDFIFLDIDNTIWNKLFNSKYIGSDKYRHFIVEDILMEITLDSYKLIRKDLSVVYELYSIINRLVQFLLYNNFDTNYYYRLLSLITLKNDLILQYNFNREQIDLYLKEVTYYIDNKLYDGDMEVFSKFFEALGKIQFAYNLGGYKKSIENIYRKIYIVHMSEYLPEPNLSYYDYGTSHIYQFILAMENFNLFVCQYMNESMIHKMSIRKLTLFWKYYKYKSMGIKGKFLYLYDAIFYKKYNFIY